MLLVTLLIAPMNTIFFMQCAKFLTEAGLDQAYIMPAMAIGQFCEVFMYVVLGALLPRLGFKKVILLGIGAYAARFILFGSVGLPLWAMVAGQALHGLCYAFYTSTCFIYANEAATKDIGNSAQSVFNFVWYGVGPLIAVLLNGGLAEHFAGAGGTLDLEGFAGFWYTLAVLAGAAFATFALFFEEEKGAETTV